MALEVYEWSWSSPPDSVEISCLMPNSIYIPLENIHTDTSLRDVKNLVWKQAPKYPLHGMLHDQTRYVFQYINELTVLDELRPDDEGIRLRDLKPYFGILRLEEKKLEDAEERMNKDISHLIDYDLNMFDLYKCSELNDFRDEMRKNGQEKVTSRKANSWEARVEHQHPTRINRGIPEVLQNRDTYHVMVHVRGEKNQFSAGPNTTPSIILSKMYLNAESDVIKVCGREEYFLKEIPIINYCYIQESLAQGVEPTLVILEKSYVLSEISNDVASQKSNNVSTSCSQTQKIESHLISSWSIDQVYSCSVVKLSNLHPGGMKVGLRIGIFHGDKPLCQYEDTADYQADEFGVVSHIVDPQFKIQVNNLPRCAKLCFVVYKLARGRCKKDPDGFNKIPIAWVNTTVFDYRGELRTGPYSLNMWRYSEDIQSNELLHPLGTVSSSHTFDTDPVIDIEFSSYSQDTVLYPDIKERKELAANIDQSATTSTRKSFNEVLTIVKSSEISKEDRKEIWAWRKEFIKEAPHLMPKVLECVDWSCRNDVVAVDDISCWWPNPSVAAALQLLGSAHADNSIRSFAVSYLSMLSNEDLSLYLLQLVQALKHECYLMCDLATLLLERAWNNMHIGHFLFWHLKSEIEVPQVSVRFRLMIEAYCQGAKEHIPGLRRQVDCLKKMKEINEIICACVDIDKARFTLIEQLKLHSEALSDINNPLDPAVRCKSLITSQCKVMNSKMRPLYLVYGNSDPLAPTDVCFIVKKGDDLRQDMLTLQILRFMEKLWKNDGEDFKMSPYGCISMERRMGMIEVIRHSQTIARIQHATKLPYASFRMDPMLEWLKQYNVETEQLKKAIDAFTLSCVGYSVATYVLGIADRHSDNIMIKENGQLFHIDFGHILGNFKKKMGFKRERAPFVLTDDFVCIISDGLGGKKGEDSEAFRRFQKKCEKAFELLREDGGMLVTLCSMMSSAGLPELNSEKDLDYLRKTLSINSTPTEALSNFKSQFKLALTEAVWTKFNWVAHYYAKYN